MPRSCAQNGAILEEQGDVAGALDAYEKARAIDPAEVPADRIAKLRDAAALAKLPAEYRAIPAAPAVDARADVAAMLARPAVGRCCAARSRARRSSPMSAATGRSSGLLRVVRAGVMDTQPNYTFQPDARVRRGDLAQTVSRVLSLIAAREAGGRQGVAVLQSRRSLMCRRHI